ncbi:sugar ABC transporter ATP-binding protein [Rhodococcus wratislaviensis]|uniref:Putative ABC transporter ATP-binding protein n=1 Tax=Rhodococcus wratislaviensis NBRC 100605 TaxID=1219028 RepID=X0PLE1_RHOWR|nr:sugar ABC transporter ATP-binding protein [Rhodococcus wratislaviensis]GAF43188.1 putative ABC transporter ATP-binding protein [Rhodococcus wratislaviensis NBRC 100605]
MTVDTAVRTGLLEARGISKRYAGVSALEDVSIALEPGKIHALIGENGAGKSTLSKILSGFATPDDGDILLDGDPVSIKSPAHAAEHGIAIVHQELSVIGSVSVAENVLVGAEPSRWGFVDRKALSTDASRYLARVGLSIDPRQDAGRLSIAEQQLVEIARTIALDARIVFFDEPTSSLPHDDSRRLLGLLRELRDAGTAVVLISHDLPEVLEYSDTITVLRDGRHIITAPTAEFTEDSLIKHMIGRELGALYHGHTSAPPSSADPILTVTGIEAPGVRAASLHVAPGEILGIGGLVGSGRTEVLQAIFGATRITAGTMMLDGTEYTASHPHEAIECGIGLVPEDRKDQGLHLGLPISSNIELASLAQMSSGPWLRRRRGTKIVDKFFRELRIKAASTSLPVGALSGGNQQKVALAKVLATNPRVLLLDEPTRGIDVGAKAEVHRLIRELADNGIAIIMVSSVLPELLGASDRIVVMRGRRTVGELSRADATEESVMRLAFQGAIT